jgi:hypothetical protein
MAAADSTAAPTPERGATVKMPEIATAEPSAYTRTPALIIPLMRQPSRCMYDCLL